MCTFLRSYPRISGVINSSAANHLVDRFHRRVDVGRSIEIYMLCSKPLSCEQVNLLIDRIDDNVRHRNNDPILIHVNIPNSTHKIMQSQFLSRGRQYVYRLFRFYCMVFKFKYLSGLATKEIETVSSSVFFKSVRLKSLRIVWMKLLT